ncbi:MAG: hypothetical protein AAF460_01390 [Pseudomonadota bacterium]
MTAHAIDATTPTTANRMTWLTVWTGHRLLTAYTVALLVILPALLLAYTLDARTVLDTNVWLKPIKFDLAIAIYLITLSAYAHLLPPHWRTSRWFNRYVAAIALTVVFEMAWLIYAAAIGEPSHFNQTHPVLAPMYGLMGVLAVLLTSLSAVFGVGILRHHESGVPALLRYAIGYSLLATAVLTVLTAGYMSSAPAQTHAVLPAGVTVLESRAGLPVLGWLMNVGDLRVAHFFSTHALHSVPLVAWVIVAAMPREATGETLTPRRIALALTLLYAVFVLGVLAQAVRGQPFV